MTYLKAYRELNKKGVIDAIINNEVAKGENSSIVKKHIMDAINYYCTFTEGDVFLKKSYWCIKDDSLHIRVINVILVALAKIEMELTTKHLEALQYLIVVRKNPRD